MKPFQKTPLGGCLIFYERGLTKDSLCPPCCLFALPRVLLPPTSSPES